MALDVFAGTDPGRGSGERQSRQDGQGRLPTFGGSGWHQDSPHAGGAVGGMGGEQPDAQAILDGMACHKSGCECARNARNGHGRTHCPAHVDGTPSLNVEWKSGTVVVHCLSLGCEQDSVIAALRDRGLWPEVRRREYVALTPPPSRTGEAGHERDAEPDDFAVSAPPESADVVDAWAQWVEKTGVPRDSWERFGVGYHAGHKLLTFPFSPHPPVKCRPWPPDPRRARFLWAAHSPLRPPLWPVPQGTLPEAIYILAGETDGGTMRHAGYPAHGISKGEGTPLDPLVYRALANAGVRRVYLLFDLDSAGMVGAHKNAEQATGAVTPYVVTLPDELLFAGLKDVNDLWRHLGCDTESFRRAIDSRVAAARPWTPESVPPDVAAVLEQRRAAPGRYAGGGYGNGRTYARGYYGHYGQGGASAGGFDPGVWATRRPS